jgi:hypothetical protein
VLSYSRAKAPRRKEFEFFLFFLGVFASWREIISYAANASFTNLNRDFLDFRIVTISFSLNITIIR